MRQDWLVGGTQVGGDSRLVSSKNPLLTADELPQDFRRTADEQPTWAFSLIEVVISMAILSIGLVGAIRVFPVGLRASQRAEQASLATLAAERTMESWKLKSWQELAPGEAVIRQGAFEITVAVDQPAQAELVDPDSLRRISVAVTWSQDGRPRSFNVVTYASRPSSVTE